MFLGSIPLEAKPGDYIYVRITRAEGIHVTVLKNSKLLISVTGRTFDNASVFLNIQVCSLKIDLSCRARVNRKEHYLTTRQISLKYLELHWFILTMKQRTIRCHPSSIAFDRFRLS